MNEQIEAPRIRLIDDRGEMLGVFPTQDALRLAREKNLDVVEVAPDTVPPVCRLMDFGKQKYRQKKKQHDAKKRQHSVEVKEIWFRPSIDPHDLNIKLANARKFLDHGFKVALTMRFRGREKNRKDFGLRVLDEIGDALKDSGRLEQEARSERNRTQVVFAPVKTKKHSQRTDKTEGHDEEAQAENAGKSVAPAQVPTENAVAAVETEMQPTGESNA